MTVDELKRMDYYELRAMIKDVIPRQHILRLMKKRSAVKEKGRKSNYHQFSLKTGEWMKLERLLNKEEINSFLIISNRVAACPMPLNMDVWDGLRCPYGCKYCFADAFKASLYSSFFDNYKDIGLRHCNPNFYKRELDKIMSDRGKDPHSIQNDIRKAIAMEIPIRLGIRFEDFIPNERQAGISLQMLNFLADHEYPVMINTKSDIVGLPQYTEALSRNKGKGAVHVTLISNNRGLLKGIEPGAPTYDERLKGMKAMVKAGIRVVARIEPYMVLINDDPSGVENYIKDVWDIGVRNITFDTYSYSAYNPGIRSNFMNYGIDFDRMFLLTSDSQAIGSLMLDKFMTMFRKKGFSCSTFDYGCAPSNNQDVCCEVGDWFEGGFNYGCGVMAVRFIRNGAGHPRTWGMFEDYVNERGGFLSESIRKEVHGLWNLTGNTAFHVNWARGIEPVGHDENGIVWRFDRKSDFRRDVVANITPDNRVWLYHPESECLYKGPLSDIDGSLEGSQLSVLTEEEAMKIKKQQEVSNGD